MSGEFILIAEDEPAISDMLVTSLEMVGYRTRKAANGQIALQMIINDPPDLVILDWMMPMMSGVELTKRLKNDERTAEIPVILLTARSDEDDKVRGLESGADDYIVKPFSIRELKARIKAILRRTGTGEKQDTLNNGALSLDSQGQTCLLNGKSVVMGPTEFRLLEFFMRHPNRVYSRSQLLDRVWGGNVYIDERTVDVHIRRLRKALSVDNYDTLVQTVRGSGYRFSPEPLAED
ncbi:MAG: phosphate regulon transcriptional regulator PhoB [Oleibacter sp.]|nr:phosphate regulon transcriptional regulator PhoB [Thalassolituus sp.]